MWGSLLLWEALKCGEVSVHKDIHVFQLCGVLQLAFFGVVWCATRAQWQSRSYKRERWSNKLHQLRCFYNDCCIDFSRFSALSIMLQCFQ